MLSNRLYDVFAYLALAMIAAVLLAPIIFTDGLVNNGDLQHPLKGSDYFKSWFYLWNDFGSHPTFDTMSRMIFTVFTLMFSSSETLAKFMILFGFLVSSLSMYFAARYVLKDKNDGIIAVSCFIAALVYAYNIWPFHRLSHWFLWMAYAILPLFFVSIMHSFRNPGKWKYALLTAILWSLASMTPHMTVFFGLIFAGMFFIFAIDSRGKLVRPLVMIVGLYLLLNMYWIYPYAASSQSSVISPPHVLTNEVLQMLSRDSSVTNVIRLTEDWWMPRNANVAPPATSLLFPLWMFASFFIPVLAFSALLLKKNDGKVLFFSLMAVIGIFLTMGSKAPFDIYSKVIFSIPFAWVFRDPDKWAYLIAFSYSFLIAVTSVEVLKFLEKLKSARAFQSVFILLVIGSIALYSYPVYKDTVEKVYNPITVPGEFERLNSYLMDINTEKVFFMPYYSEVMTWSQNHTIAKIYQMSSSKPNIQPLSPASKYYYDYFADSVLSNRSRINNFVYPLGTSYVVYHNDTSNQNSIDLLDRLGSSKGIKNVANIGFYKVFKTDGDAGELNVLRQNIAIAGGMDRFASLDSLDSFSTLNSSLVFLDQGTAGNNADTVILNGEPFVDTKYFLSPFDVAVHHDPSNVWSKAGATDPLHGPFHPYIEDLGMGNSDFDYGRGLVFTWSSAVIDENIEVSENDTIDTYDFENDSSGWDVNEAQSMNISSDSYSGKHSIQVTLNESSWGWKTVASPLIPVSLAPYRWVFYVRGENSENVHAKIAEYDIEGELIDAEQFEAIGTGTFGWKKVSFDYKPSGRDVAYMQLQVWHGHETKQPLPNKVWIDGVKAYDLSNYAKPVALNMTFDAPGNSSLLIRYFKNEKGGRIDLSIDGERVRRINTFDQLNKFTWENAANITKGRHVLTLTNVDGFNAVNVFALIPEKEYSAMNGRIKLSGKRIAYVFEAETDLYNSDALVSDNYLSFDETSEAWQTVSVLRPDNYTMALKGNGEFNVKIDKIDYTVSSDNLAYIGPIYLAKGEHTIEITGNASELDALWLYSGGDTLQDVFTAKEIPAVISYTKINPTLYKVQVNASKNFMLSFAETYDPLWSARVNGTTIRPVPLYSVVNGFWINQTGDLDVTIEYEPEVWFNAGAVVSIITLFVSMGYLVYGRERKPKEVPAWRGWR